MLKKLKPYGHPKDRPWDDPSDDAFFAPQASKGKPPGHGGFKVVIPANFGLKPDEEDAIVKKAHEELYREWLGEKPADGMSYADMRDAIEARSGKLNIRIVPVRMDPHDRVGSFILHMDHLDTFLKESRTRLVADAIQELASMGTTASTFGDEASSNKFELCRALLKMQKADRSTGIFDESHDEALNRLRSNSNLRQAFRSAEKNLLKMELRNAAQPSPERSGQRPPLDKNPLSRRDSGVGL